MDAQTQKIVWYEGMTLDPHHFQQWDRYHEAQLDARIRGVTGLGWGLTALSVDRDRLANGVLSLRACSGILPDGMVFDLPASGPLPQPRSVEETLASTDTRQTAYLALPTPTAGRRLIERPSREAAVRPNGEPAESDPDEPPHAPAAPTHTRYRTTTATFRDDTTGADEQSIEVAQVNAQIRVGGEPMEGFTTLPIARIQRDGGGFELDPTFIPPVLHLGVSSRLHTLSERVLEMLVAHGQTLRQRQQEATTQREFAPSDAIRMGMLTAVNGAIPALRHHLDGGPDHPAVLFHTLAMLAGKLSALAPTLPPPQEHPVYRHRTPTRAFNTLFDLIQSALQGARTTDAYRRIGLEKQRETLYVTPLSADDRAATLLLSARSDARGEEQLVRQLPHMFRIASSSTIDQVLGHSVSALRVEPTRRLPPGMPVDERASYFRLLKDGPFWDAIVEDGDLALFLPAEYADVTLDLIATS